LPLHFQVSYQQIVLHPRARRSAMMDGSWQACLLLLFANPGDDIRNLTRVALRMPAGEWVR
jgi:hypothetical protein